MRAGLAIVIALAVGALAANFLLQDNGYVLINFRGYLVEMSVPILVFLLILAYLTVRILVHVWRAPRQLGEMAARRRTRKAGELITRGYIEMGQGNFARGEKLLTKGARNSATPLLNYLAAARAAQAQGHSQRRDNWLQMASEQEPRAREAILVTRAELQIEIGENEAALETVTELMKLAPRNVEGLKLRAQLAIDADDWTTLEDVLPQLRRHGNTPVTLVDDWTVKAWCALLDAAGADPVRAKVLWKSLPRHLRDHGKIVGAHARSLVANGKVSEAESELRSALNRNWDDELIIQYAQLNSPDYTARLRRAEKWLSVRPDDPVLLLAAGRLCVKSELWGKARSYYESSAAIQPAPQTWHELGQLMVRMGDQKMAFDAFQKGLTQSYGGSQLPRLPQKLSDD